jgi:hypothetical protein
MTTTKFYAPTNIQTVDSFNEVIKKPSVPWQYTEDILNSENYAITQGPLTTVSGFWQEKFFTETSQVWATGYNIGNFGAVVGIEVQIGTQRKARIQDLIIQLTLNGELIGDNYAILEQSSQTDWNTGEYTTPAAPAKDIQLYGGPADMWGTELTTADITDSSFGVVVSFKSNQVTPHSDLVYLNQIAVRITYA